MKKLFFALAAVLFAACATDVTEDVAIGTPETIEVSFEEDSRIQLQNGKTVWTEGDLVSVFYRSDANQQWKFQGKTGDRSGKLKCVSSYTSATKLPKVVVVYPYNENYYINPQSCNVEATLPATQTYIANSYGLDGNVMVSSSEYNQVYLRSICGWLKIQLTGNGEKVQSIKLKGNNSEQIAGQLYIDTTDASVILAENMAESDDNGLGGMLEFDNTILTEVALNCGEGVTLGAEPTAFYIALPPQEFSKGLTIEIACSDGSTMTKSTEKEVVIARNTIQPMAAIEYEGYVPQSWKEIRYTATEKAIPFETNVFGANVVSNEWNSTTREGIITFDGKVTSIGKYAFYRCSSLTSVTIPDSVTEIGYAAFASCDSLTSVTIPDSVTSIGVQALYNCTSLTSVTIGDSVTEIGAWAFYNCSSLTSVTIPDSVTSIGDCAFYDCSSLTSVTIPNSVTSIGSSAFGYCSSLTSITIPDSVTEIGWYAFHSCSSLKEVYCKPTTPPSGGRYMFNSNASSRKIYVPRASVDAYKAASGWSDYADAIVAEEDYVVSNVSGQYNPKDHTVTFTFTANDQTARMLYLVGDVNLENDALGIKFLGNENYYTADEMVKKWRTYCYAKGLSTNYSLITLEKPAGEVLVALCIPYSQSGIRGELAYAIWDGTAFKTLADYYKK